MNRRRLVSLISNWLVAWPASTPAPSPLLVDAAGRAFVGEPRSHARIGYLTVMVHAYANDHAALIAARLLLDDAGVIDSHGQPSAMDRREWALPASLASVDGGLVSWRTVNGGASETTWVTGVFSRNTLVWEISANAAGRNDLSGGVLDLAMNLTARQVQEIPATDLWSLLPAESDLPAPMRLDAVYSHSRDNTDVGSIAA